MNWKSVKEDGLPENSEDLLLYSEMFDDCTTGAFVGGVEFQCDDPSMHYMEEEVSHYMKIDKPKVRPNVETVDLNFPPPADDD